MDKGKAKQAWFARFLELSNGIPFHDTFGWVFGLWAPDRFQACFLSWVQAVTEVIGGEVGRLMARRCAAHMTDGPGSGQFISYGECLGGGELASVGTAKDGGEIE